MQRQNPYVISIDAEKASDKIQHHFHDKSFDEARDLSHLSLTLFLAILAFFEVIVNEMIFLYSFLICSLLVYRKATDFCKIILYTANLLKMFMGPKSPMMKLGIEGMYLDTIKAIYDKPIATSY
jgi:hypothetical protein